MTRRQQHRNSTEDELQDRPAGPGRELVCVGKIVGPFGVRGEAKIASFCDPPEAVAGYSPLVSQDRQQEFRVEITGRTRSTLTVRLQGVETRQQAEELSGIGLYAGRACFPDTEEDEFYCTDLIGLMARDTGGEPLGRIAGVLNFGAGDVLELASPDGPPLLVPFNRQAVPEIRFAERLVMIDRDRF